MLSQLEKDLAKLANPDKARILSKFFKTGKGEYGDGDVFLGIQVPYLRQTVKKYPELNFADLQKLLNNKIHEHRLTALLILVLKYQNRKTTSDEKKQIVEFYLTNTKKINNWDLVDLSCQYILGNWFLDKDRKILYNLAKSKNIWERRIAVISTFGFLRQQDFSTTLEMSKLLLTDKHDLIHKAVGWMLREVGKRDQQILLDFLEKYYQQMPRVMLRYSIEKLNQQQKNKYLNKAL